MPPLDLSDSDLAVLAMACRSAAHHASGRALRRRGSPVPASPQTFIALAERLEATQTARQNPGGISRLNAEERARLGWGIDEGKTE